MEKIMKIKTFLIVITAAIIIPAISAAPKLPEQFAGKKVKLCKGVTFPGFKNVIKPKDADSPFGHVVAISGKKVNISRNGFIGFGVWDKENKTSLCSFKLPVKQVPQDEKYHLYKVGKITLKNNTSYFYGSSSWLLQCTLKDLYKANATPEDNTYEVYVSAKVTGQDYVKNSTKENMLFIDAIYLVK